MGAERGRATKPKLKLGVCGEHGGDPESIQLFYDAGLDYVSCSPFRVPIARLAAAQSVIASAQALTPAVLASSPRLVSAAEGSGNFVDITVHAWQWVGAARR